MKKIQITLLTGILLIVSAGVLMAGPLPQQPQNLDLAITGIASRSDKIAVGDMVVFDVTYQNKIPITVTTSISFNLKLTASQKVSPEKYRVCTKLITATEKIVTSTVSFDGCNLRFEDQGVHTIKAELQSADGKEFKDLDPNNNMKEIEVSVAPYQSALPDEIGRIFAGLGLLSAVMAIMAAGTEVIIDVLRVVLGMKSKVTAIDALQQMRQVLPGELAALGVGTSSREAVKRLTTDLQTQLKPVTDGAAALNDLADLGTTLRAPYFEKVDNLIKTEPFDPNDKTAKDDLKSKRAEALKELEGFEEAFLNRPLTFLKGVVEKINKVLEAKVDGWSGKLANDFETGFKGQIQAIKPPQIDQLQTAISGFDPNDGFAESSEESTKKKLTDAKKDLEAKVDEKTKSIAKAVQECSPQLAISWLETQRDAFKTQSTAVRSQLDAFVGSLADSGLLPQKTAADAKDGLGGWVQNAITAGDRTVDSLKYLLKGVEDRRNETQSPVRKVWRILREMEHGTSVIVIVAGIVVGLVSGYALYLNANPLTLPPTPQNVWDPVGAGLGWVILAILASGVPALVLWIKTRNNNGANNKQASQGGLDWPLIGLGCWAIVVLLLAVDPFKLWPSFLGLPLWLRNLLIETFAPQWGKSLSWPEWAANWTAWGGWIIGFITLVSALALIKTVASVGGSLYKMKNSKAWDTLNAPENAPEIKYRDLHKIEFLFNELRGEKDNDPTKYGDAKPRTDLTDLTAENAAGKVVALADLHDDEEGSRLRWMRAISVPIGIVLAYNLKIDAFDYLKIAVPALQPPIIDMVRFGLPKELTAGMILTGFAASAGSAFWHDQLARLQAVRQQAEAAATSLKQVEATVKGEKQ